MRSDKRGSELARWRRAAEISPGEDRDFLGGGGRGLRRGLAAAEEEEVASGDLIRVTASFDLGA